MERATGGGMSLFGVLGVIFVVLKLTGLISWSWWWVLLPWYAPIVFLILVIIVGIGTASIKGFKG